jgi:myo-inositol-1(or 4)-monophosphatase
MEENARCLRLAMEAAREAGRIQMNHLGRSQPMELKGDFNPVTEVDRLSERAIVKRIVEAFPDHDVLAEETPFEGKGSSWKWIVDPLDGTTNYSHGFPFFSVSIGLEAYGEVILGVVYVPPLEELFHAEKGKGAFLNGRQISVSRADDLNRSLLCTGFPYDVRDHVDHYLMYFKNFIVRSFAIRRPGSAAIDLCYLAAGRFDGFWELNLQPWDVAAGSLMITEAGGKVTDFKGEPFRIYSKEILATNGLIHEQMLEVMRNVQVISDQ